MPTLLEIGSEIQAIQSLILERDGDITDIESEIDEWFNAAHERRDEKLDAYAGLIRELESRALVRENEASRLAHRAKVDANKASVLKNRLKAFFELTGLKRIETTRFRLTLAANGGKRPVVATVAPESLPKAFQKVNVQVLTNKKALRDYVEKHGELKGPDGKVLAYMGDRSASIRIR